jgi:hypothetical protein
VLHHKARIAIWAELGGADQFTNRGVELVPPQVAFFSRWNSTPGIGSLKLVYWLMPCTSEQVKAVMKPRSNASAPISRRKATCPRS